MKKLSYLFIILSLSVVGSSQTVPRSSVKPKTVRKNAAPPVPQPTPPPPSDPAAEKIALDDALAAATPVEKIARIEKFLKSYPASAERTRALESLTGARAALADEKLAAGEIDAAVALFRDALNKAPTPYSDRFFGEVVSRIPTNLYWRGLGDEALAAAKVIEKNIGTNVNYLVILGNFYVSIENGDEAKRLADAAIKINESSAGAYIISGHANRLNFALDEASASYSKALEIEPTSLIAMRGKAEMQRALGKPEIAAALYSDLIAKNGSDHLARAGLVLSLFDNGKRIEAESEMAKAIEANPRNVVLLAGAAYWYAAQGDAAKAVDFGQQAVSAEPRYIWSHVALARGLMAQRKPLDAERVLTAARKYGNFPTLEYEIATARVMSGFYREAAIELAKSFTVTDGAVETRLGGRIRKREKSISDLVAYERRASIFQPASADLPEMSERIKALLNFSQTLQTASPDETALLASADEFISGDDKMKLHRQLFVANELLQKRVAIEKVLELTKSALGNTDTALETPDAPAAVMANELYESRNIAFSRDDYLLVPNVSKQTLSAILRGRIEELAGRALSSQKNYREATVRLRRAVSVYPEKSAWMRSGMWHLGEALEGDGKDKEALDNYIASYKTDKPDVLKYVVVENLYRKVNGTLEGFEAQVGPNPLQSSVVAAAAADAAAKSEAAAVKLESPQSTVVPESTKSEEKLTRPERAESVKTDSLPVKTDASKKVPEPVELDKPEPDKVSPDNVQPGKTTPAKLEIEKSEPAKSAVEKTDAPVEVPETIEIKSEVPDPSEPPTTIPPGSEAKNPAANASEVKVPQITTIDAKVRDTNAAGDVKPAVPQPEIKSPEKQAPAEIESTLEERSKQRDPAIENPVDTDKKSTVSPKTEKTNVEPENTDPPSVSDPETSKKVSPSSTNPEKPRIDERRSGFEVVTTDNTLVQKPITSIPTANKPLFEPVIITIPNGIDRPRVVDGSEVRADVAPSCTLSLSDESVSVINDGGSISVLVNVNGSNDADMIASSSSPKDIDVRADSTVLASPARRFYTIKSVSTALGLYEVTFTSPCGKATLTVKVR